MNRVHLVLVTACGMGYLRPAPGTFGSMPPVILATLLAWWCPGRIADDVPLTYVDGALAVLTVAASMVCLQFGSRAEQHFGKKDAGAIVIDEVAGQSLVLLFLPWRSVADANAWTWNIAIAMTAFATFRTMDILKPPPARSLQNIPGGRGILIDDLVAAGYAIALTQIVCRMILPRVIQ